MTFSATQDWLLPPLTRRAEVVLLAARCCGARAMTTIWPGTSRTASRTARS